MAGIRAAGPQSHDGVPAPSIADHAATAKIVAFYLPQFHPVPENDTWWGPGYTEWVAVGAARKLFRGHRSPHLPGELGFYDLRVAETRAAQAELAREHGVSAFCYWHYWFGNGRRLLERPLQEVVVSGQPDFPFCVGWANHSWNRAWEGNPNEVLIQQEYPGPDDHRAHFDALLPMFLDPRYFRLDGAPLMMVFRPHEIPDCLRTLDLWRELAQRNGLGGLHFLGQARGELVDPRAVGFDSALWVSGPPLGCRNRTQRGWQRLRGGPRVVSYEQAVRFFAEQGRRFPEHIPFVLSGWDDTPRRGRRGDVLKDFTPDAFGLHVREVLAGVDPQKNPHRLVFLKSWNEWAEGNYVEPDRDFGRGFLEALRDEVRRASAGDPALARMNIS